MHWTLIIASTSALAGAVYGQNATQALPFPTSCQGVPAMRFQYEIDPGWKVTKIGSGLKQPRTVIFDSLGNMLVLQQTYGISVHTFGADGCINSSSTIAENRGLNHGLALTPDGKTLYASSETNVWSWDYDPVTKKLGTQKTVVQGISTGIHSTRSIAIVPNAPNLVLVQAGSNANLDMATISPSAGRSCVKVFDMSQVPSGGYKYNTDGYFLGYGMRNGVAMAFDPNNHVWEAENSGDDFRRTINGQATDIHIDNPAEELNYLGDPTTPNDKWYGYPTCFTAWDGPGIKGADPLKTGDQFVLTPNATFNDASCAEKSTPPRLSFPAHSAPIAADFDLLAQNLYVSLHGSWNRQPAIGYRVIEIPFQKTANGEYEPVAARDSMKGWNDIFWAKDVGSCQSTTLTRSTCFRLTAVTWDPAGTRLFVASDNQAEGELFILAKK